MHAGEMRRRRFCEDFHRLFKRGCNNRRHRIDALRRRQRNGCKSIGRGKKPRGCIEACSERRRQDRSKCQRCNRRRNHYSGRRLLRSIGHTRLQPYRTASQTASLLLFIVLITSLIVGGCSSSETTQKDASVPSTDTAYSQSQQLPTPKTSPSPRLSSSGKQEGFVTQEDTIEAEVITRHHGMNHLKSSRRSLKKKYYSVQLGSFRVLSNADRAKKIAQQRYKKAGLPILR